MTNRFVNNIITRLEALEAAVEKLKRDAGKRANGKTSSRGIFIPFVRVRPRQSTKSTKRKKK